MLDGAWDPTLLAVGLDVVFVDCVSVVWSEAMSKQDPGEFGFQGPVWVREVDLGGDSWVKCLVVVAFAGGCVVVLPCVDDLAFDV